MLGELLSEASRVLGCARDGEEAADEIQRMRPAPILGNVKMSKLNGIGLAARLATCGCETLENLTSAGHRGWLRVAAIFIRKPFDLDCPSPFSPTS